MKVSIIVTVFNEGEAIRALMDSLCAQTRLPDEVIMVDAGSRDDTVPVIREYESRLPLTICVIPGCNISEGRNRAIEIADGDVIASTDAGVALSPEWLAEIVAPFERTDPPEVVSGFYHSAPRTVFEVAMGATVLPELREIDPSAFLPSSRSVAFTKRAWQAVGGYPEWLDYCEDLVFDFRLRDHAGRLAFVPEAIAHFRPRGSLRAFFVQYYRYSRGDGKADLWRLRHAIRYSSYLIGIPGIIVAGFWSPWLWLAGAAVAFRGLFFTPYRRLLPALRTLPWRGRITAVLWVPLLRVTGDVAKMIGYPVGLAWRMRRRKRDARLSWRAPASIPPGHTPPPA